jgi:hypothetical protein
MKIFRYNQFILERLGVPDKIINSATNLYESILSDFQKKPSEMPISDIITVGFSDEAKVIAKKSSDSEDYKVDLPITIEIGDLKFNSVELEVSLSLTTSLEEDKVDIISWGVLNMPDTDKNYVLYFDKSLIDKINLRVNFAISYDAKFSDICDFLIKDRAHTIGILSHELKHVYDRYMFGKSFLEDVVDYQTWSNTRTGFKAIDQFIYYIYIISKTESLVRSTELAGELVTSGITKSEFKEFLQENSTYKKLIDIKNFTYDGLKKNLLEDIEAIRGLFKDLTDESDEEVIEVALDITYRMIIGDSAEKMAEILRLNDENLEAFRELEIRIFGMCKDIEFYKNYVDKRIFNSTNDFFLYWEKKFNFEAEKVIKKIIKLYDMCKDENLNPLMSKITNRVDGQCIVNPKLYDELVVKPNTKPKYTKK